MIPEGMIPETMIPDHKWVLEKKKKKRLSNGIRPILTWYYLHPELLYGSLRYLRSEESNNLQ